jgi:hypothetical protein
MVLGLFAFAISASAQATRQYRANVPFDFSVGNKVLKAGAYTITPASSNTNLHALILRDSSNGKASTFGQAFVDLGAPEVPGQMNFIKTDNGWVLQSIETSSFALRLRKGVKADNRNVASDFYSSETRTVAIGN